MRDAVGWAILPAGGGLHRFVKHSAGLAAMAAALAVAPAAPAATWVAGDGHVHTCYSHDAYCGPTDDEGQDAFYSFGGTVDERFAEASAKGLQFLVISDHDDVRAHADPAFGTHGVVGVHAYEASLSGGHAQMLGALRQYPKGAGDAAATVAMADALRADGGVFQANHPGYRVTGAPLATCADAESSRMHWRYGFGVLPDTVEVWNATTLLQPSELFWECWLQRGARLGALAGSDSHGANHLNVGIPSTWALAASSREADVLAAIRAGRTTLSRVPPSQGAVRLLLEGDRDGDGRFESAIGDEVPVGAPLRVRAEGAPLRGLLRVRANGRTVVDGEELAPGGTLALRAPAEPGWARATLYLAGGTAAVDPGCAPPDTELGSPPIATCSEDLAVAAMTSPIWVGPAAAAPRVDAGGPAPAPVAGEPDDRAPIPPAQQSGGGSLPDVPPQRGRAARVRALRATWFRRARAGLASQRVRLRWSAAEGPFEVQGRRAGGRGGWRMLARGVSRRAVVVRLRRDGWRVRVRARPPLADPSAWRTVGFRL